MKGKIHTGGTSIVSYSFWVDSHHWRCILSYSLHHPPNVLSGSSRESLFHNVYTQLCEIFIKFFVREKSLPKGVHCCFLIAVWDKNIILFESTYILFKRLSSVLVNPVSLLPVSLTFYYC